MTPQAVATRTSLSPDRRAPAPGLAGACRVAAVVPCFNRAEDAQRVLADLGEVARKNVQLRVLIVDNGSDPPLGSLRIPASVPVEVLRVVSNTGGSGGFNAGMLRALGLDEGARTAAGSPWSAWNPEFLWLVDSDARVRSDALDELLKTMLADSSIIAAGAAVHDPQTGRCFEVAGRVNRRTGEYEPAVSGKVGVIGHVEGDYVPAACALVRSELVRSCGGMPDRFLNGDDVEWFIRLKQVSGGRIVGVPSAVCWHPRYDRFSTWQRYYSTRNSLAPIRALGLPAKTRWVRAFRDARRAAHQELLRRPDLAALHLAGLRDAVRAQPAGRAPEGAIRVEPARSMDELEAAIESVRVRESLKSAVVLPGPWLSPADRAAAERSLSGAGLRAAVRKTRNSLGVWSAALLAARTVVWPGVDLAVVPARGGPEAWWGAKWFVQLGGGSFVVRRGRPVWGALRAAVALLKGAALAFRAGLNPGRGPSRLDSELAASLATGGPGRSLSLEAIVLSHNRPEALERTLSALSEDPVFRTDAGADGAIRSITVVDNGSIDRTPDLVREKFPHVRLIALADNLGVEAFNRAASQSNADILLILDDDAIPDARSIGIGLDRLAREPARAGVALLPRHPRTGASEWPFADRFRGAPSENWPLMGCANLIRRDAWARAGGYESGFFLYRNDTDLALRLLGAGCAVHFDPDLIAWHDTPAHPGMAKSRRWHELATRNWIWMARRHGRGGWRALGAAVGWAWAHRLAGLRIGAHAATLRGAWAGLTRTPPTPVPPTLASGWPWEHLIRLRMRGTGSPR